MHCKVTRTCYLMILVYFISLAIYSVTTVDMERLAGLNIRGFSPIKFFAGILSQCIGHQC